MQYTPERVARAALSTIIDPGTPALLMQVHQYGGEHMFHDVRFGEDGSKKAHPLNEARYAGATILLSNSKPVPGSFGSSTSLTLAYCPVPPVCFLCV